MGIARTLRFTGYVYHTATRSKLLSRESRQPSRRGARLSATGIRNHRYEIKSFPMPPLARDVMIADLRIPTKPAMHSNLKPATRSDLKPAKVPT
jgi:hypothetical protein